MFAEFWRVHPALFVGLHLLLGAAFALHPHAAWIISLALLWIPLALTPRALLSHVWVLLFLISGWAYTHYLSPSHSLTSPTQGTGYLEIHSVKLQASPFNKSYCYKGMLRHFQTDDGAVATRLPVTLYVPLKGKRPAADSDYLVTGTLIPKGLHHYHFKPKKKQAWQHVKSTFSLAEWRYNMKEKTRSCLKRWIPDSRSSAFLTALATGDLEERSLMLEFNRLGLQHILAISGFHFAFLTAFCAFWLRLVFSPKKAAAILLVLISLYFLFLGNAPSVQRAWIAILLFLLGSLLHLRTSGLNVLGVALIIEVALDPLCITQIGFQLSFLATLGILLFYAPCNALIDKLLPARTLTTLAQMNRFNQHGYIIAAYLRKALALSGSVHLTTTAVVLCLFHKLPLLSLVYNLFFPFWVGISLLLLLTGAILTPIVPPLAMLIHQANSGFTSALLTLTSHPPAFLDFCVRTPSFSFSVAVICTTVAILTGLLIFENGKKQVPYIL